VRHGGMPLNHHWQRKDLQQKYRGLFSWYLEQKIEPGRTDSREDAHR
jgi:hypothetical protein